MDSRACSARALLAFEQVRSHIRPLVAISPIIKREVSSLEQELIETASAVTELFQENEQLRATSHMSFANGVLWDIEGAYCPACGINQHQVIHLEECCETPGSYSCPHCLSSFVVSI